MVVLIFFVSIFGYVYYADVTAAEKVELNIEDVSIPEIRFTYCKLKFTLNISNPTNHKISSLSLSFSIYLANISIGNGSMKDISIHAYSSIKKNMVITIYYANLVEGAISAIKNEKFLLTLEGKSKVDVLFGLTEVSKNFKISYEYP